MKYSLMSNQNFFSEVLQGFCKGFAKLKGLET